MNSFLNFGLGLNLYPSNIANIGDQIQWVAVMYINESGSSPTENSTFCCLCWFLSYYIQYF